MPTARRLAWAWTLCIVVALSLPGTTLPETGSTLPVDKVVHFGLFLAFAMLWRRAGVGAAWIIGLGGAFALLMEPYQGLLIPGRAADPYDALMNLAGLAAGLLISRGGRGHLVQTQTPARGQTLPTQERYRHPAGKKG